MEAAEGANPVADLARARWTEPSALPGSPLGHGRITLLRRRPHDGVRRVGEGRGGLSFCAAKRPGRSRRDRHDAAAGQSDRRRDWRRHYRRPPPNEAG